MNLRFIRNEAITNNRKVNEYAYLPLSVAGNLNDIPVQTMFLIFCICLIEAVIAPANNVASLYATVTHAATLSQPRCRLCQ